MVMPAFDGLKLLSMKKGRSELDDIPVIMLTGEQDVEAKVRGLAAGAADFVVKPFHDRELVARAQAQLELRGLRLRLREQNDRLQRLTQVDPLTGLLNRRAFMDTLRREISRVDRHGGGLGFVMVDLDHFKLINDNHGHPAGDAALVHAAGILTQAVRSHDVLGRYGGEEFCLLLIEVDADGAGQVAARCRQRLRGTPVQVNGESIRVTASLGIALHVAASGEGLEELILRADTALYQAKAEGRDRVVMAPSSGKAPRETSPSKANAAG
jgi:diguanylate cyclase (GGDEF)-like protein